MIALRSSRKLGDVVGNDDPQITEKSTIGLDAIMFDVTELVRLT
eukprot:CAMPEP_0172447118 /NCGR_PEP_ID=MMETSP1065-20121228/6494_1 /TAXON_ID=265537 /ORGANISM="Amphiprora paludosa, Strain CCMP125" /LENGTH=43 /DNA_ID= /DNA_START= /DNA_END= /DNA_ORIENTATION=